VLPVGRLQHPSPDSLKT